MALRRATGARTRPRVRRLAPVLFLLVVVAAPLSAPGPVPVGSAAEAAAARRLLPPVMAPAPAEPVGRLPAVGLTARATAPAASAVPSPSVDAAPPTPVAPPAAAVETETAEPVRPTLPLDVEPPGSQLLTVVAASSSATTARFTAWELGPDGWTAVLGPVSARVGAAGVGRASETSTKTPAGTFGLTEAFGRAADPGTALPYTLVDGDDWWVADPASPRYNTYAECAPGTCDFDEAAGEDLYAAGAVYDHAVVIDHNRGGTPGAGSAYFLHIGNGAPTAGCVAIDRGSLQAVLRWLDPAASPVISIGVG